MLLIFEQLIPSIPLPSEVEFLRREEVRNWLDVRNVCRRWNVIVVNAPSLWTRVFLTDYRYVKDCLSFSRNAYLHICSMPWVTDDASRGLLKLVLPESHRIKTLDLNISDRALAGLFPLSQENGSSAGFWRADSLTTFRLSLSFRLSRDDFLHGQNSLFSFSDLLLFLSSARNLQTLVLKTESCEGRCYIPSFDRRQIVSSGKIIFPNMKRVEMEMDCFSILRFVSYCQTPWNCIRLLDMSRNHISGDRCGLWCPSPHLSMGSTILKELFKTSIATEDNFNCCPEVSHLCFDMRQESPQTGIMTINLGGTADGMYSRIRLAFHDEQTVDVILRTLWDASPPFSSISTVEGSTVVDRLEILLKIPEVPLFLDRVRSEVTSRAKAYQ